MYKEADSACSDLMWDHPLPVYETAVRFEPVWDQLACNPADDPTSCLTSLVSGNWLLDPWTAFRPYTDF